MVNKEYFDVAGQVVSIGPNGILKIDGQHRGATDVFIQVFDANQTPANGAVPIKSWYVPSGSDAAPTPFFQSFLAGELRCDNGVYVCVSDTDGQLTLSANKMDVSVELETEDPFLGGVVTGDNSTPTTSINPWANNQGPKRLRRVEFQSSDPDMGTTYIQVHGKANPADGDIPLAEWKLAQNTYANIIRTFGDLGLLIASGCKILGSSTAGKLTANGTNYCLKSVHTAA